MRASLPALALLAALLPGAAVEAGEPPVFATGEGAIRGYDPVAYFTLGVPTPGDPRYTLTHDGAKWRFSSAATLEAFRADPQRYAPRYGGYCAYAVGNGYTASTDPEAWSIVDGRLYLNYSKGVQKRWEAKRDEYIAAGDRNWPGVLE